MEICRTPGSRNGRQLHGGAAVMHDFLASRLECAILARGFRLGVLHHGRWEVLEATHDGRSAGVLVVGQWSEYRRTHLVLATPIAIGFVTVPLTFVGWILLVVVPWPSVLLVAVFRFLVGGAVLCGRVLHRNRPRLVAAAATAPADVPIIVVAAHRGVDGFYASCGASPFRVTSDEPCGPGMWWWPVASRIMQPGTRHPE